MKNEKNNYPQYNKVNTKNNATVNTLLLLIVLISLILMIILTAFTFTSYKTFKNQNENQQFKINSINKPFDTPEILTPLKQEEFTNNSQPKNKEKSETTPESEGEIQPTINITPIPTNNIETPINIEISRKECIAPCSIHLTIKGTSWELLNNIDNTWDFGDGQKSNGNIAAHVYENSGYYTIKLTSKIDNNIQQTTQTINVIDQKEYYDNSQIFCFATDNNNWEGCPTNNQIITNNFAQDVLPYITSNNLILFRRGDIWNISQIVLNGVTNLTISNFGNGNNKPRLQTDFEAFKIFGNNGNIIINDIEIEGLDIDDDWAVRFMPNQNPSNHILFNKVNVNQFGSAFRAQGGVNNLMFNKVLVNHTQKYGFFPSGGNNYAILNSIITRTSMINEHAFRTCGGTNGIIKNTTFINNNRDNIHIRSNAQKWLITNNYLGDVLDQTIGKGEITKLQRCSGGEEANEYPENIIIDANIFDNHYLSIKKGRNIIVKNNIILYNKGIILGGNDEGDLPDNIEIKHNTQYNDVQNNYFVSGLNTIINKIEIVNNLFSAQAVSEGNNLKFNISTNLNINEGVIFVNSNNPKEGGLALVKGSAGIDSGTKTNVFRDYKNINRPQGNKWDIGAYEFLN